MPSKGAAQSWDKTAFSLHGLFRCRYRAASREVRETREGTRVARSVPSLRIRGFSARRKKVSVRVNVPDRSSVSPLGPFFYGPSAL